MAPRKLKPTSNDETAEIYIRWARAFILCNDAEQAARGVGIEEGNIEAFLDMARYSAEAQKIISEHATFIPDFNSPEKVKQALLNQLWNEARATGSASGAAARVAALRAIADIAGIADPEEAKATSNRGGMLMIPVMSMDKWEKACEKAQAALRTEVHV